eukprot:902080-Rhodomonas_salina.1
MCHLLPALCRLLKLSRKGISRGEAKKKGCIMYKPLSGYDANTLKLLKVILSFVRELESDPGAGASMLGSHTF